MRPQDREHWDKAGWYGATTGATLYIYIAAVELLWQTRSALYFAFSLLAATSVVGLAAYLWKRRDEISFRAAAQVLVWAAFLAAIATFALRDASGVGTYTLKQYWWALLVFPFLSATVPFRFGAPALQAPKTIKTFGPSDHPIEQNEVFSEEGGWRIEADRPRTARLFEAAVANVEGGMITYRATLKTAGVSGQAYLEMWCRLPDRGEFFSKGLHNAVGGSTGWASYEIPFMLKKGQRPDLIKLNLVFTAGGTAWIKDIELLHAAPR